MVKLTTGWANLKDMDNFDKVVSIVLYNYPPGKGEIEHLIWMFSKALMIY